MSALVRIAIAVSLLSIAQGASAKDTSKEVQSHCSKLLTSQPTTADYALSDLEGMFFDVIKKMQAADELTPARVEAYIKDILNMKAQVLNRALQLLPVAQKPETVASIYQILETFGIPPGFYGLEINKEGQLVRHGPTYKIGPIPPEENGPHIGFVSLGHKPYRDLPQGLSRSIGFGPERIESEAHPERMTGFIQSMVSPKDPNMLIIYDGEKKVAYAANLQFLHLGGIELNDRTYQLVFNQDIGEWIVAVENLANPSGKIGF